MRILMLSDVYFPRVNGVSSSIRTYARELAALGHDVTVVAPAYDAPPPDDGFPVRTLPARVIFFDPEDRLIKGAALRGIEDELAREHWDVIHVHTPFQAHRLGLRLARRLGVRVVETYHTYFEQYVGHYLPWLPARVTRALARGLSRKLCHDVDHLIVPSQQMADVLTGYGIRTPATVVPTGIDLAEFSGGDGARFRAAHGIVATQPVLVTVSRLSQEKNIGFLLAVAQRLIVDFPDLVFIIAGEGPDAPRLKALAATLGIADHVRFFGNLDRRTTLLDCYRAGDVFVFASPTETQGLVLTEAMALGVPVVSTAVMGTATVLAGTRSSRVAREDIGDFAGHVATVLRDAALRAELSAAGPADARAWSAPVLMQRAVAVYGRLAAARRPGKPAPGAPPGVGTDAR